MDWAEKYRPAHIQDLVGNRESIRQMVLWAQNWTSESKPLILYGKPGIGKTSSAYALANDMNWEIIELNASDQRTKSIIEKIAGSSATTGSLTGAVHKLVILDEADNLQGNADRGGARAINSIIKQAKQPMILIANDLYGLTSEIRNSCEKIQFRAIQTRTILPRIRNICSQEGINCSDDALREISENAGGDIRAAVNMLYASSIGRGELAGDDISISQKDHRSTIFDLVGATFGMKTDQDLLKISFEVDDTPDTIMQWIEANVSFLNHPQKISVAYESLASADVYIGRTLRTQYYTLWRYATALMLFGVHNAAYGEKHRFKIGSPKRWRKMATAKKQKNIRSSVFSKLGHAMHMAQGEVREDYLRTVSILAENNPKLFATSFSFDVEQLDFLIQDKKQAKNVLKEIENEKKAEQKKQLKIKKELQKLQKNKKVQTKLTSIQEETPQKETEKKPSESQSTLFSFGG